MLPLSMTNVGDAPLTIDAAIPTGTSFSAHLVDTLPVVLEPGASSTVEVTFSPTESGHFSGALWVTSDAPSGTISAPFTGTSGVPVAVCSANPSQVFAHQESADFYGHDSYDLGGGSMEDLLASCRRLLALDGQTQVLPGHGPTSTIEEERSNPFLI